MNLKNYLKCQWDRAGAVACFLAGVVCLMVGYLGVSGTRDTADQIPYVVSGGMVGLLLFSAGVMLWLSADMRDEWRKLDAIESRLSSPGANSLADHVAASAAATSASANSAPADDTVTAQEIALR